MKRFFASKENRTSLSLNTFFHYYFVIITTTLMSTHSHRHLLLVVIIISCSEFLYSKSTLVPDRIGIPLFSVEFVLAVFFLE
jgi:hypothetical protein